MKAKKQLRGYGTILLFAVAATLLIFSTAGSSRAALTYYSETYGAEVSMQDIGVTLVENGKDISYRDYNEETRAGDWDEKTGKLLEDMVPADEEFQPGRKYDEVLTVKNSGTIDEYVRVTIYRYWQDANGNRCTDLDPGLIDLHLTEGSGWFEDTVAATPERTVLYYKDILSSEDGNNVTPAFADALTIKGLDGVEVTVKTENDGAGNITTTYVYDSKTFVLQVDVDAVQTHSAVDAIRSAWGVNAEMAGGTIIGVSY